MNTKDAKLSVLYIEMFNVRQLKPRQLYSNKVEVKSVLLIAVGLFQF